MKPRFSIIIPIYKVEDFLHKCVDSLLCQDYSNVEIILVDDGSPDGCPQICDDYAKQDNRIKVIHKVNGGLVSARQAGCKVAEGDYIIAVDGDDWVADNYFETLDKIVDVYCPDIICFGAFYACDDKYEEHRNSLKAGKYDREDIEKMVFPYLIEDSRCKYFTPSIWSKAIRREIYIRSQMSVNTKIKIGEDHAVSKLAIYEANSMYISDECLYYYRINPLSMTKNKHSFDWDGPELIGRHFEKNIPLAQMDFKQQIARNVTHNLFNVAVSQFYSSRKYGEIKKDIKDNLSRVYYIEAINNCQYDKFIGRLSKYLLKHRCVLIMYIISKIR